MKDEPLKNLQAKVDPDYFNLFERAYEQSDCNTKGAFMELIIEKFLNPKTVTVEVSKTEDTETIKNLTDEIDGLRSQLHVLQNTEPGSLQADTERITELEGKLFRTESELTILKEKQPAEDPDVITIRLNPAMSELVDKCVNRATVRTGKEFTRTDIFQNLFWEALTNGRASLPIIFSSAEIASVIKKHKEAEPQE